MAARFNSQRQAGPFLITLFSDPSEVRVGRVDLSVLCQKSDDKSTILDAKVFLHLTKPGGAEIVEFTLPASHEAATNKTLYAAHLDLPAAGKWKVKVDTRRGSDEASVTGDLNVLPKEPAARYLLAILRYRAAYRTALCDQSAAEERPRTPASASTALAAFRPLIAITLPPGCVQAPQR